MNVIKGRMRFLAVAIPVLVALVLAGYLIYLKYQETRRLANPAQATQEDVQKLIDRVGRLIVLPQGETPTVATVSDVTKLKDQQFFANAVNGDRVLIYQAAKKAYLYRPGENKIIEVAPVNIGPVNEATPSTAKETQPAVIRFVLYNGTATTGLTRKFEITLKERVPSAQVTDRDNAAADTYSSSLLIDISGTKKAQADTLARALDLKVSSLPKGEKAPQNADFLVILGSDAVGLSGSPSATPSVGQ